MTVVFQTPLAGLVALAGFVPVALALVRDRRAGVVRRALGLEEPTVWSRLARPLGLACAFGLLGLAATQPSLARQQARLVRTDAELLVVLDNSRSMLASAGKGTLPRYRRATLFATRLHAALPELPAGVAALNNRLLPYLFPTGDGRAFDAVVRRAYGIQKPPPAVDPDPVATVFGRLADVTSQTFFSPHARRRVLAVLSDAETRPFAARRTLAVLRASRVTPVLVRFWQPGERIPHTNYHATEPDELDALRGAGWPAYTERQLAGVVRRIRRAVGTGPEAPAGYRRSETPIAAELALAALAPLLLLLVPAGRLPLRRRGYAR